MRRPRKRAGALAIATGCQQISTTPDPLAKRFVVTAPSSGSCRILVVDDEPVVRRFATRVLEAEGFLVSQAADGAEALRLLREAVPAVDAVVSDIVMPRLNGVEAIRQIKRDVPSTEVVVLSVHDSEAYVVQALRAGARMLVHSVDDAEVDDEFLALAKKNGTVYCPTLTVLDGYVRLNRWVLDGKPPAVDDPNGCVDAETRAKIASVPPSPGAEAAAKLQRFEGYSAAASKTMAANLRKISAAGIPVAMGTDAGNPLTLHGPSVYAEMEAMQAAGMTPMDVIVAASRGGARAMGVEKEAGTLERGKAADLIVVGGDPTKDVANLRKLRYVVRAGMIHPIEELRPPAH